MACYTDPCDEHKTRVDGTSARQAHKRRARCLTAADEEHTSRSDLASHSWPSSFLTWLIGTNPLMPKSVTSRPRSTHPCTSTRIVSRMLFDSSSRV